MDLVYICRNGDNEELRYSIRSAVTNLKHDNLWVVGGKPDWYCGNYIEVPQLLTKFENAKANMVAISDSKEISDDFILMNDDFFIVSPVKRIDAYYGGLLKARIRQLQRRHRTSPYILMLQRTFRTLKRMGISNPLDYALHIPFKMNKKKLMEILKLDISWRIAYGNIYNIGGSLVKVKDGKSTDVKLYLKDGKPEGIEDNSLTKKFLSSQDNTFEFLLPMLQEMFPAPSQYELEGPTMGL